jgi:hypothetical protein
MTEVLATKIEPASMSKNPDLLKQADIEKIENSRQKIAALLSYFASEHGWGLKKDICRDSFQNMDILVDKINAAFDGYSKTENIQIRNEAKYLFIKSILGQLNNKKSNDFANDVEQAINNNLSKL